MKKYFKYAALICILLITGFILLHYFRGKESNTITLQTDIVKKGEIVISVTATGTVEPVDQVEVGTQVSGLVSKIYVDYNSLVKKGQLLAELDKTNLNEAVRNAQAAYNAALNELNYYQLNYKRQQSMFDAGVISRADYEQASYQAQNAEATLSQRKAALAQTRTSLEYASIYSPIDGIVITKDVEEGQTVAASMTTPTLFTIAKDITKMQVEADVDEADIGNVQTGQRVSFTVDAYPELEFSGKVRQVRLGATTTSNVVTYTVIIEADNPEQKLKPGLTATITIYTKELKGIPTISTQALSFHPDQELLGRYYQMQNINPPTVPPIPQKENGKQVWIKNTDGSIRPQTIQIGANDGIHAEVLDQLQLGDTVVIKLAESAGEATTNSKSQESPFMPKPPGKRNKKATL